MSTLAITITIFLAVFFGLLAIFLYFNRSVNPVAKRLEKLRNEPSVDGGGAAAGYGSGSAEGLLVVDPESFSSLRADLTHAGYRGKHSVAWYRGLSIGLGVVYGIVAYSFVSTLPFEDGMVILLAFGAAAAGYATPHLWVQHRVTRRREDIRRSVPNVLDLIIVCVEAGLGLNAAVQRIAREMRHTYPELSRELNILNQEIFLGINRAEAFRNLALRTGVDELRSLATVLMQSDRLGTSVADVLRVQAENLRTKRRQMAMEIAAKMPVKLIFPLVLFIFPQLILVILGPAMIQIFRTLSEMAN
jgi:tight adherence protein C